jgi:hypothetical protein
MTTTKTKKHYTPSKTSTATNKQADILLRQIKTENAVKDLVRSNKKLGIVTPKSVRVSTTTTPSTQTTTKSKKK